MVPTLPTVPHLSHKTGWRRPGGNLTHLLRVWGLNDDPEIVVWGETGLPQVVLHKHREPTHAAHYSLLQTVTFRLRSR